MRLSSHINRLAMKKRRRIAMGIDSNRDRGTILSSASAAGVFADIVLVGNLQKKPRNVEVLMSDSPEETLANLLASGKVDACVRGNLDAGRTISSLRKTFPEEKICRAVLLETKNGFFFLAPVGIDEGRTVGDKVEIIKKSAALLARLGMEPKVGVLSGGRKEDAERNSEIRKSIEDAEKVTEKATALGINTANYQILIEDAVRERNLVIAPDGVSGNLIFRTLVFLGSGKGWGAPVLMEKVFVDTSRAKKDYIGAIKLACALANA
jgi:putative methanogen marker protein 4